MRLTQNFKLLGVVFLALGFIKLLRGDDWVVWIILGVVFGGLAIFNRTGAGQS